MLILQWISKLNFYLTHDVRVEVTEIITTTRFTASFFILPAGDTRVEFQIPQSLEILWIILLLFNSECVGDQKLQSNSCTLSNLQKKINVFFHLHSVLEFPATEQYYYYQKQKKKKKGPKSDLGQARFKKD